MKTVTILYQYSNLLKGDTLRWEVKKYVSLIEQYNYLRIMKHKNLLSPSLEKHLCKSFFSKDKYDDRFVIWVSMG